MKHAAYITILVLAAIMFIEVGYCDNAPSARDDNTEAHQSKIGKLFGNIWAKFIEIQRDFNLKLSTTLNRLKEGLSFKHFLLLIVFAMLYGVVHALGPGHGKMLVSAYFLDTKGTLFRALRMGAIVAATHCGSALILGSIFGLVVKTAGMNRQAEAQNIVGIIGGILISALGIIYFLSRLPAVRKKFKNIGKIKNDALMGVLSGIIPCPVAMTIILFSIYIGAFHLGIIAVVALSVGMAATVAAIGIITIEFKQSFLKILAKKSKRLALFQNIFGIIGSLAIVCLGILMIFMNC